MINSRYLVQLTGAMLLATSGERAIAFNDSLGIGNGAWGMGHCAWGETMPNVPCPTGRDGAQLPITKQAVSQERSEIGSLLASRSLIAVADSPDRTVSSFAQWASMAFNRQVSHPREDIAPENSDNLLLPQAIATPDEQNISLENSANLLSLQMPATPESPKIVLENSGNLLLPEKPATPDEQNIAWEDSGNSLLSQMPAGLEAQDIFFENSANLLLPEMAASREAPDIDLENSAKLLVPEAIAVEAPAIDLENSAKLVVPDAIATPESPDIGLENSGDLLWPQTLENPEKQDIVLDNSANLLVLSEIATEKSPTTIDLQNSGNLLLPQAIATPEAPAIDLENSGNLLVPEAIATEEGPEEPEAPAIAPENSGNLLVPEAIATEEAPTIAPENSVGASGRKPLQVPRAIADAELPAIDSQFPPIPETETQPLDIEVPSPPVDSEQRSLKILAPAAGETFDAPAATIILQFPAGTEIELQVNGKPVSKDLIGRTETAGEIVTQTWYGVPLEEGENAITAIVLNSETGSETISQPGSEPQCPMPNAQCPTIVFVRGAPIQISVETLEARIPADGRSIATITGQLLDDNSKISTRDTTVTLSTSAGEFVGVDYDTDQPGFQVEAVNGQFSASLRAGFDATTVRIRASIPNLNPGDNNEPTVANRYIEAFTRMEFTTYLRPSLVTGVVDFRFGRRGTDFWEGFEDFLPPDENNEYETDLSGVAFATGRIGSWLFTGAYNSERSLNKGCNCDRNRLLGDTQFSEQIYPTYGDRSSSQRTTPSSDSVYLRLERSSAIANAGPDYFMWGDYNISELSTRSQQFTAFTQVLHGFKGNYTLGPLQVTGMYATDIEGFQRDTIPPDGTGGFYFLSRRLVIEGSENIFIETEELDRPGTVLSRQQLNRGQDYEIDYDRGTILFHRPILRTDVATSLEGISTTVVRRIVATYQYDSQEGDTNLYGGRLRYHFSRELDSPSWLGATYIRQDQGIRDFELYGADMLLSFGEPTAAARGQLIAEYAHSTNDSELLGLVVGEAYRVDFNGFFGPLNLNTYYRSTDSGFANDATTSFVPGQTRYGGRLNANLTNSTQLQLSYDYEENSGNAPRPLTVFDDLINPRTEAIPGPGVDNSLRTITAGLQQRIGSGTVGLDYIQRHREDDLATSPLDTTSSQLRSRLLVPITNTLSFHAQNEINLSDEQDLVYPNRTIIGADLQVLPGVSLGVNHQFFSGGQFDDNSITTVGLNGDYNLTEDTALIGRYSFVNGQTMSAALGIRHGWTIRPGLRLNLAYEHIFGSLFDRSGSTAQFRQPFAPGQSASSLGIRGGDTYSIGLEYTDNPDFQASARYDRRFSSSGNNTVISAAATGKPTDSLSVLARYQQASSSNPLLDDIGDTINLRLGLAYRNPNSDKLNALLRYEFRQNPSTIPDSILFGSGTRSEDHTLALETIYAPNWQWELYGKYAWRKSTSFLADDLAGTSMLSLTQLRATYRFAYRWDIAAEGRWIHQPEASYDEIGAVAELGFYLTPDLRLSAGYVFGNVSDREFDSDRSSGGPYVGLTMKLNQLWPGFGNQSVTPGGQQESQIK